MYEYIIGTMVGLIIAQIYYQIHLTKQIDILGEMLHVLMFHPEELEAWDIISSLNMIEKIEEDPEDSNESWDNCDEKTIKHEKETIK